MMKKYSNFERENIKNAYQSFSILWNDLQMWWNSNFVSPKTLSMHAWDSKDRWIPDEFHEIKHIKALNAKWFDKKTSNKFLVLSCFWLILIKIGSDRALGCGERSTLQLRALHGHNFMLFWQLLNMFLIFKWLSLSSTDRWSLVNSIHFCCGGAHDKTLKPICRKP